MNSLIILIFCTLLLNGRLDISKGPSQRGILRTFGLRTPCSFWKKILFKGVAWKVITWWTHSGTLTKNLHYHFIVSHCSLSTNAWKRKTPKSKRRIINCNKMGKSERKTIVPWERLYWLYCRSYLFNQPWFTEGAQHHPAPVLGAMRLFATRALNTEDVLWIPA